jgi:hypothetical protein
MTRTFIWTEACNKLSYLVQRSLRCLQLYDILLSIIIMFYKWSFQYSRISQLLPTMMFSTHRPGPTILSLAQPIPRPVPQALLDAVRAPWLPARVSRPRVVCHANRFMLPRYEQLVFPRPRCVRNRIFIGDLVNWLLYRWSLIFLKIWVFVRSSWILD